MALVPEPLVAKLNSAGAEVPDAGTEIVRYLKEERRLRHDSIVQKVYRIADFASELGDPEKSRIYFAKAQHYPGPLTEDSVISKEMAKTISRIESPYKIMALLNEIAQPGDGITRIERSEIMRALTDPKRRGSAEKINAMTGEEAVAHFKLVAKTARAHNWHDKRAD